MNDRSFLRSFSATGDPAAFAELVRRHGAMVHAAAQRMGGQDADDVAQAVFLLLWRKARHLQERESIAGWLYETTCLCACNARRSRARHQRALAASVKETAMPTTMPAGGEAAWAEVLDEGLRRLPSAEREAVVLRHMEGLSVAEAAASLATTETAISKRTGRALSRLRAFFRARGYPALDERVGAGFLLALPLSGGQVAKLSGSMSQPSVRAAALARATARTITFGTLKLFAAVAVAASGVIVVGVGGYWLIHPAHAAAIVVAEIPTTEGDIPLTEPASTSPAPTVAQAAFNAAGTQFLAAIHDANVDRAAALLDLASPAAARLQAQSLILSLQQAYRADPSRILQQQGTFNEYDDYSTLVDGGIDVQPPIDADVEHLALRLVLKEDGYRVADASMISGNAMMNRVEDPRLLEDHRYRAAYAAWEQWTEAARAFQRGGLPPDQAKAGMREVLACYRMRLPAFVNAVNKTDFPMAPAFVPGLVRTLDDLMKTLDRDGVAAVEARLKDADHGTLSVLLNEGDALKEQAAAEEMDAAQPVAGPHPVAVDPDLTLPIEGDRTIVIPGPLEVPRWLLHTAAYRLGRTSGRGFLLQTTDDAGNRYNVWCDSTPAQGDQPAEEFASIWQYRKDGTLAAMTDRRDGMARDWQVVNMAGKRYVWRIYEEQGMRASGPPTIPHYSRIEHFAPDGSQHGWAFDPHGKFESEWQLDATGHESQQSDR